MAEDGEVESQWIKYWTPMAMDYGEYDPLRAGSIDGTGLTPHDRGIIRAMSAKCKLTYKFGQHSSTLLILLCRHASQKLRE